MTSIIGLLMAALVLAAAGGASWAVGSAETRMVDAHAQLATLQYAATVAAADAAERASADALVTPDLLSLGRRIVTHYDAAAPDARDLRATADYWRASFASIAPRKDAAGLVVETDVTILTLAANASFRASQAVADYAEALRKLDTAVKNYTELLKADGGAEDTAYNYEFAVRMRDALMKQRTPALPRGGPHAPAPVSDIPEGRTLHGPAGGPPPSIDMSQFRIVIPKRAEERTDAPEAGKGGTKVRKG